MHRKYTETCNDPVQFYFERFLSLANKIKAKTLFWSMHAQIPQCTSIWNGVCTNVVFYLLYFQQHGMWHTIRYFLVISIPAETPVFSFIDHVIWRKLQASLLPVWVATPDVNVNTTSFTVKMERPIKLSKDWCCVPQCKSDGRKRGK